MNRRISIYQFTDYRKYLDSYYKMRKSQETGYSFRAFSRQLGFSSPNYIKLIIDGVRHVGNNTIDQIASGLELQSLEAEYFKQLILFAKAKSEEDRNFFFNQIARLRAGKIASKVENIQYAFYEHWYNCIIRELVVGMTAETLNYSELARMVVPPIHYKQAQQSVNLLLELNFITIDSNGKFCHSSPILNTENEVSSYAVKRYHHQMIEFGKESIDRFERDQREISSVTMRISEEGFQKMKKRIQDFRHEILSLLEEDSGSDCVTQLNMQLFPVSHPLRENL